MSAVKLAAGTAIGMTGTLAVAMFAFAGGAAGLIPLIGTAALAYAFDAEKPGTIGRGIAFGGVGSLAALTLAMTVADPIDNLFTGARTAGFGAESKKRNDALRAAARKL